MFFSIFNSKAKFYIDLDAKKKIFTKKDIKLIINDSISHVIHSKLPQGLQTFGMLNNPM